MVYDTIDDRKNPHNGVYAKFHQEYAGVGGDANFLKTTFKGSYYKTLFQEMDIVGLVGVHVGHIEGFGNGLRVFDLFKNNQDTIRRFKYAGIGPRDGTVKDANGSFLGGTTHFNVIVETQFPLPVFLRAWVFAAHCLPMPRRFMATNSRMETVGGAYPTMAWNDVRQLA
ncbi:outer membrane protein assembly factor BamA [Phyllobacterium myrsinacearum]|uniref:Outer membrane protein assembly factor BamA n=1 Tax=Phyllobacterium myrsinacearum TaxID=28101 RepID=A0A839EPF9_9HYPH|nr:outer membrane protein assembly factor BamA [Phyllobacterium myrsinacearum]